MRGLVFNIFIVTIWTSQYSHAYLEGGDDFTHGCSAKKPVKCYNGQCCQRDEFCGDRSEQCEDCFPADDGLAWCQRIEGLDDPASHYRNPTCAGACLFRYRDNITIQWTSDSSHTCTYLWLFVITAVLLLLLSVALALVCWLSKSHRVFTYSLSKTKDQKIDHEERNCTDEQPQGSIDIEQYKTLKRKISTTIDPHPTNTDAVINVSASKVDDGMDDDVNDTEQTVRKSLLVADSNPGPQRGAHANTDTVVTVSESNDDGRMDDGNNNDDAHVNPVPQTGAQQTDGAARSNGKRINPVVTAADENGPSAYSL